MKDCKDAIVDIYNHPDIVSLISKIEPAYIRDDLRQEVAITLLEQPCERIVSLMASDNLLRYSARVCWVMATSKTSRFFNTYKKSDLKKAIEYLRSLQSMPAIPINHAYIAQNALSQKNSNIYEDHEVRIFNKYIELGSARAVAAYYNIPLNHTCNVINKVKTELKCLLRQ